MVKLIVKGEYCHMHNYYWLHACAGKNSWTTIWLGTKLSNLLHVSSLLSQVVLPSNSDVPHCCGIAWPLIALSFRVVPLSHFCMHPALLTFLRILVGIHGPWAELLPPLAHMAQLYCPYYRHTISPNLNHDESWRNGDAHYHWFLHGQLEHRLVSLWTLGYSL